MILHWRVLTCINAGCYHNEALGSLQNNPLPSWTVYKLVSWSSCWVFRSEGSSLQACGIFRNRRRQRAYKVPSHVVYFNVNLLIDEISAKFQMEFCHLFRTLWTASTCFLFLAISRSTHSILSLGLTFISSTTGFALGHIRSKLTFNRARCIFLLKILGAENLTLNFIQPFVLLLKSWQKTRTTLFFRTWEGDDSKTRWNFEKKYNTFFTMPSYS